MPNDPDVNIRLRVTKEGDATPEVRREIEETAAAAERAGERIVKANERVAESEKGKATARQEYHRITASAATAMAGGQDLEQETAQLDELVRNTREFGNELRELLSVPPQNRTAEEVEKIATAIAILKENAESLRAASGTLGDPLQADRLSRLATAASVQANRAEAAIDPAKGRREFNMTAAEAAALGTGLRGAGVQGGFLASSLTRVINVANAGRLALFALGGAAGGAALVGISKLFAAIAQGASRTPEFQRGLNNVNEAAKGLGDQFSRAVSPVTKFFGALAGDTLDFFARAVHGASESLADFNDKLGIPSAARAKQEIAELTEQVGQLGDKIDAAAKALEAEGKISGDIAKSFGEAADRAEALAAAQDRIRLSEIDREEQAGLLNPQQAARERLAIRTAADQRRAEAAIKAATEEARRNQQLLEAAQAERDQTQQRLAEVEAKFAEVEAQARQAIPDETPEMTRSRLEAARPKTTFGTVAVPVSDRDVAEANRAENIEREKQREELVAGLREEVRLAREKAEAIRAAVAERTREAEAASQAVQLAQAEMQVVANEAATAAAKQERDERIAAIEEEKAALEANHQIRMQMIEESAATEQEKLRQKQAEERKYFSERLQMENQLAALRGEEPGSLAQKTRLTNYAANFQATATPRADLVAGSPGPLTPPGGKGRHFDAGGNLIAGDGEAFYGRSRALGTVQAPSMLDQFRAETIARREAGMPGSGASPAQKAAAQDRSMEAALAKAKEEAVAGITAAVRSMEGIAREVVQLERTASASLSTVQQAFDGIGRKIEKVAQQVANGNR